MPRLNIIILQKDMSDTDGNTFTYVFWADVPAARQSRYADTAVPPTRKSVWSGATGADNTALQNGSVVEGVFSQRVPAGSSLAQMQAFLQQQWTSYQASITNYNPWNRYGSTWDGSTWTMVNNG